jgi:DNA-directed RNA polymerase specialized sigma24 family protein
MEIDDAVFVAARLGKRQPAIDVIVRYVPEAFAIATLLTGSFEVGRQAIHRLTVASMKQLPTWTDPDEGRRWFRHQAVLVARQLGTSGVDDVHVFARADSALPAGFPAFIRAVRKLPQQQQESFLLQHGLGFDPRERGVAMDCSTTAAQTHLQEAERQLIPLLGADYNLMRVTLRDGATRLLDVQDPHGFVARRYRSPRGRRRRDAMLGLLVILCASAGVAWLAWSYRNEIREFLETLPTRPSSTQPVNTQPS